MCSKLEQVRVYAKNLRSTLFTKKILLQSDKLSLCDLARVPTATPRRRLTGDGFRAPLPPSKKPAGGQARFRRSARLARKALPYEPDVHDALATTSPRSGTEGTFNNHQAPSPGQPPGWRAHHQLRPLPWRKPSLFDIVNQRSNCGTDHVLHARSCVRGNGNERAV